MTTNLERFKKDLDRLIGQGQLLDMAIVKECAEKDFMKQLGSALPADKIEAFLKNIPDFKSTYEAWYSESLALLRQLLPDRVDNFISMYEKPKNRKHVLYGNYVIQDYMQGLTVGDRVGPDAAVPQYRQQLSILKAAAARFNSSLFEIKQLVQADLFDSELETARELQKHKFFRAAGAIAGVVLEKHLHQVCSDRGVKIAKKHPGINDLNEVLKSNSIVDIPQWRLISMLADIRNICDHNKQKEPTDTQVTDLIDGTEKILKTVV
jgi:hypothetical protein